MTATAQNSQRSEAAGPIISVLDSSDWCSRELADAEKELGAFLRTIEAEYGPSKTMHAAECWLQLAETAPLSQSLDKSFWRSLTVRAISRMVRQGVLSRRIPLTRDRWVV